MLPQVKTPIQKLEKYKEIIPNPLFKEINDLAKDFRGLRVIHVNSTPQGGGVAEVLKSLVPLMKGAGVRTQWHVIPPVREFFEATKELHNTLQGKEISLGKEFQNLYQHYSEKFAKLVLDMKADIWIFHDPQPMGIIRFLPNSGFRPIISRVHIDTSNPNLEAWNFIERFLMEYDKIIFSTKEFAYKGIAKEKIVIFPPAIDPLIEKNKPLSISSAKKILENFGVDSKKPLISQISRFDPWKDPIGVIRAYRLAKKKIPGLQLVLIGLFLAYDDPEAVRVLKEVEREARGDNDIFLFSDPARLGGLKIDRFINAFQTGSDVVLQKSIKEGFGITVAEAMWKSKAVIGGKVGGIKLQIENGKNGFLVSSSKEASQRIIELIDNRRLRQKLGRAAKKTVQEKFLMPRLLRDYLKLFKKLLY